MSFRKGPFHFGDIDPAKRREELLKRFNSLRSDDSGHASMFCDPSPMTSNWPDWQGRMPRRGYFDEPEWRTRPGSFPQTGSNPGSPHFPRSGMNMAHGPAWIPDDETIPIKVVHEKGNHNSRQDDSAESDSSSHSSQNNSSSQKRTEPRVHHIPIMIEPRDGSSSGYASFDEAKSSNHDSAQDQSTRESDKWPNQSTHQTRMNFEPTNAANGTCRQSPGQPLHQSPIHNPSNSPKSSPLNSPQPNDTSPFGVRAKVHSIPIKIENDGSSVNRSAPLRSQSAKVGPLPSKPSPVNRSASSPVTGGQFKSTSRGAQCGKTQPKQGGSAPCSPSGANGPYVTKVPINVDNSGPHKKDEPQRRRQAQGMPPPQHHHTPSKSPAGPLDKIAEIRKEVERLKKCVEEFQGTAQDKEYRFLDEMLTRCMLRLDDIDTGGRDDIRQQRKACVNEVHQCVAQLEAKGKNQTPPESSTQKFENDSNKVEVLNSDDQKESEQEAMQVEENPNAAPSKETQSKEEEMQVEENQTIDVNPENANTEEQKMEMDTCSSGTKRPDDTKSSDNAVQENKTTEKMDAADGGEEAKGQSEEALVQEDHSGQTEAAKAPDSENKEASEMVQTTKDDMAKIDDKPIQPVESNQKNSPTLHRTEVTLNLSGDFPVDSTVQQTKL